MNDYLNFMASNWRPTFFFFLFVGSVFYLAMNLIFRFFRVINIALRGWPPDHLNADGDWKEKQKGEQDE